MENKVIITGPIKRTFKLTLNGKSVIDFEAEGDEKIVNAFSDIFTDSFGIFYKLKDQIGKFILNELEVTMDTIFRDNKGKFLSRDTLQKKVEVKES